MSTILGLDLGSNSLGWALIDEDKKEILGTGVRIFPEGVENFGDGKGKEVSRNASRREHRQRRRQLFRKKMRKRLLAELLHENSMMPITRAELDEWKNKGKIPQSAALKQWFALDTYALRARATTTRISLEELGRVFYHLAQRRGFQTNSRGGELDSKTLLEGKPEDGKQGIASTLEQMGEHTLGTYLHNIQPKEGEPFVAGLPRIRNRYTSREMYIQEFERIWAQQAQHHTLLTAALKEQIGGRKKEDEFQQDGILFYQRPLRSQKFLIGKCSFETTKPRLPISHPLFEEFRAWQFVNTIEVNDNKLNPEQRQLAFHVLMSKEKVKFKAIRTKLKLLDAYYGFNYPDDHQCPGSYTNSTLENAKIFGKNWNTLDLKTKEDIWHILFSADDKAWLKNYAINKLSLAEKNAANFSKVLLKDGYSNLSRKAILTILPYLEKGYLYTDAVALGGIRSAFGNRWTQLSDEEKGMIEDTAISIMARKETGGYIDLIKAFLQEQFSLTAKQLKKLYHPSTDISDAKQAITLPTGADADREIAKIKNPAVMQALFEVRKVVNAIIKEYGTPDQINVEIARELKASAERRLETKIRQAQNRKKNDIARDVLEQQNQPITHDNILKVRLWQECRHICPYTGNSIGIKQLFNGDVQIEHIVPWSRCLDDSYINKTLCFADENRNKGERTPYEYYSRQGEGKWQEVVERAKDLLAHPDSYQKFKRFVSKEIPNLNSFINRQLSDTRYISKAAKDYLKKICNDVNVAPGQLTAKLRVMWGLNSLIDEENQEKNRADHRHHAIDALVMASFKRRFLQELSKWNRYERTYDVKNFPMPWDNFRLQAIESINGILVSHKKTNRVLTKRLVKTKKKGNNYTNIGIAARGQLHKETIYGKRTVHGQTAYHVNKELASLTTKKQVDKIVDPAIRKIIHQHIASLGGYEKEKNIPKGAFFTTDENGQLQARIKLPNKRGEKVPVHSVRMRENLGNAEKVKEDIDQFVNPRNNHHILIYKDKEGNLREEVVTFWIAAERKRQGQPVVQLPADGHEIVTTLQINDMFILGMSEDQIKEAQPQALTIHLYRIQKLSASDYNFRKHLASTLDFDEDVIRIKSMGAWQKANPIKVKVLPTGTILLP